MKKINLNRENFYTDTLEYGTTQITFIAGRKLYNVTFKVSKGSIFVKIVGTEGRYHYFLHRHVNFDKFFLQNAQDIQNAQRIQQFVSARYLLSEDFTGARKIF